MRNVMNDFRKEMDSLGEVDVPADKLWGAQTQRSLEHFSIGTDLILREMITGYAILKKGADPPAHAVRASPNDEARSFICTAAPSKTRPRPSGRCMTALRTQSR